ncbi:hypothetical protein [Puia sp.]|jgi:hypothetical protein|uniref:hypothetical protein n=1 Tax=Puia sp. TaxID=2045100 RepID=UPI002F411CE3
MADLNRPAETNSFIDEPRKIPEMLNVLTILTFVGSGLFTLTSLWGFASAQKSYDALLDAQSKLDQMPAFARKFAGPEMLEVAQKSVENRTPILLMSLISCALCIYGAIQMRQLKKAGFTLYTIGELLPIPTSMFFIGTHFFSGIVAMLGGLIYVVFIVLYATQLKHLR